MALSEKQVAESRDGLSSYAYDRRLIVISDDGQNQKLKRLLNELEMLPTLSPALRESVLWAVVVRYQEHTYSLGLEPGSNNQQVADWVGDQTDVIYATLQRYVQDRTLADLLDLLG